MASRGQPVCRKEDCSPFDIGFVYQTIGRFSAPEKLGYIQNIWKLDQLFVFPQTCEAGGKLRKFRFEWLMRFPWLVYSKYLDGAFCLPYLCFGMECGKNGNKLNKLFESPLPSLRPWFSVAWVITQEITTTQRKERWQPRRCQPAGNLPSVTSISNRQWWYEAEGTF